MRRAKDKRRILGGAPRPAKSAVPPRLMRLVVGAAYVSAKATGLRAVWGNQAVFMVLEVPARCTTHSVVKALGPNGMILMTAGDLRPAVDTSETAQAAE